MFDIRDSLRKHELPVFVEGPKSSLKAPKSSLKAPKGALNAPKENWTFTLAGFYLHYLLWLMQTIFN